jgi:hypothetical protein
MNSTRLLTSIMATKDEIVIDFKTRFICIDDWKRRKKCRKVFGSFSSIESSYTTNVVY